MRIASTRDGRAAPTTCASEAWCCDIHLTVSWQRGVTARMQCWHLEYATLQGLRLMHTKAFVKGNLRSYRHWVGKQLYRQPTLPNSTVTSPAVPWPSNCRGNTLDRDPPVSRPHFGAANRGSTNCTSDEHRSANKIGQPRHSTPQSSHISREFAGSDTQGTLCATKLCISSRVKPVDFTVRDSTPTSARGNGQLSSRALSCPSHAHHDEQRV